jgi:hypothetical protein
MLADAQAGPELVKSRQLQNSVLDFARGGVPLAADDAFSIAGSLGFISSL